MTYSRLGPAAAAAAVVLASPALPAARRTVIKTRTTIVVAAGFPLHRPLPRAVLVRPSRTPVAIGAPLVFLAPVTFRPVVVTPPHPERLVWQDAERISRPEDWVDLHFGVDRRGGALLLDLQGRARISFAEVTFAGGHVQVIDFQDRVCPPGLYTLLDFPGGRHVKTVRVLARSRSADAAFRLLLRM
jgi:hypothetical protein